jgi:transposase
MEQANGQLPTGRYSASGNYDKAFIAQVVAEVQQGKPRQAACLEYGIRLWTLKSWLLNSKLGIGSVKLKSPASAQFKRTVVRSIQSGRMKVQEARQAYGIKSEGTIRRWIKQLKQENDDLGGVNDTLMKKKKPANPTSASDNAAIKALQQALADAQLKVAALNTLIDVAEEQLKINIRKKPGAKQSND